MNIINTIEKKFNCNLCNYHTNKPSDWIKHMNSNKHLRNGKKKPVNCTLCDYIGLTHWNLKMHILVNHSTIEERSTQKYYCNYCDQIFFCNSYMKTHNNGIHHKNMILAIQLNEKLQKNINNTNT
jgi:hypothetical protein